jgi:hypothetical protein
LWRAREAEGCTCLADVEPARTINGQVRAVVLYTRAVRCAAAELSETHRDVTATGQTRIDDDRLTAGDYRRLCTETVRDLLGTTRVAVDLL